MAAWPTWIGAQSKLRCCVNMLVDLFWQNVLPVVRLCADDGTDEPIENDDDDDGGTDYGTDGRR